MRWLVFLGVLLASAWQPARVAADTGGWAIPAGWYFEQHGGYAVRDTGDQPFWTTFQALGGTASLGYPLSRRFAWQGRTVQVFERGVLAYDPTTLAIEPLAILDALSARGHDATLAVQFGVPPSAPAREALDGPATAWADTCIPCRRLVRLPSGASLPRSAFIAERLTWLATVPALVRFYDTTPWAAAVLGVPAAQPQRRGTATLVRFQRGVVRVEPSAAAAQPTSDSIVLLDIGVMARSVGLFASGEHWDPEPLSRPQPQSAPRPAAAAVAAGAAPSVARRPAAQAPGSTPLRGPIVRGNPATGTVALTFDLGLTSAGALPIVLDTLDHAHVRATFFITGAWAEAQPDLLRRIVAAGHELANHSYSHPDFTKLDAATARWEIEHTEQLALAISGRSTKPHFRPPFGAYNQSVLALVEGLGYRLVMWTLDSADWRPESTAATIVQRVGGRTEPGDVAVMHGYVPKTAQALETILQQLAARGLRAGTLSEALGLP